jgi:hypothetical protein
MCARERETQRPITITACAIGKDRYGSGLGAFPFFRQIIFSHSCSFLPRDRSNRPATISPSPSPYLSSGKGWICTVTRPCRASASAFARCLVAVRTKANFSYKNFLPTFLSHQNFSTHKLLTFPSHCFNFNQTFNFNMN